MHNDSQTFSTSKVLNWQTLEHRSPSDKIFAFFDVLIQNVHESQDQNNHSLHAVILLDYLWMKL